MTRTGPARGRARIVVSHVARTLDLRRTTTSYRVVAWSHAWSGLGTRTVKVVVVGTSGRPTVEVDVFAVLR